MTFRTRLYINGNRNNDFPESVSSLDNEEVTWAISFYTLDQQSKLGDEVRLYNPLINVSLYVTEVDEDSSDFNDWLSGITG